jgi:hypothetical protein
MYRIMGQTCQNKVDTPLVAMQEMMTKEQAMLWLGTVVAILKRHIADRNTLQKISLDLTALMPH